MKILPNKIQGILKFKHPIVCILDSKNDELPVIITLWIQNLTMRLFTASIQISNPPIINVRTLRKVLLM